MASSETWWCVKDSQGILMAWTARKTEDNSVAAFFQKMTTFNDDWMRADSAGYRCVQVEVREPSARKD